MANAFERIVHATGQSNVIPNHILWPMLALWAAGMRTRADIEAELGFEATGSDAALLTFLKDTYDGVQADKKAAFIYLLEGMAILAEQATEGDGSYGASLKENIATFQSEVTTLAGTI